MIKYIVAIILNELLSVRSIKNKKRIYFTFTYSFSDTLPFFMEISQYCGGSLWLAPSGVFNRASGNSLATVEVFPTCVLVPAGESLLLEVVTLCIHLSLQSLGQQFSLCPRLSYESQKSWFFRLFSFLFVVRTEWQLPSSLYAKLKTRSSLN